MTGSSQDASEFQRRDRGRKSSKGKRKKRDALSKRCDPRENSLQPAFENLVSAAIVTQIISIITVTQQGRYFLSHFTDKQTEAQRC